MRFKFLRGPVVMLSLLSISFVGSLPYSGSITYGQDLPAVESITAKKLFEVPSYCEGVVFDHAGAGYISWDKTLTKFQLNGENGTFAVTGAPNGHKVLADGSQIGRAHV